MHLLYVEDNSRDADLTLRELSKTAPWVHVDLVSTMRDALSRLDGSAKFHYDLVLTDMRLPDGDGLGVLAHIRRQSLPMGVIVITGSSDEKTAIAALKSGADDYIVKRTNYLVSLPVIIEQVLQRCRAEASRRAHPLRVLYAEPNATDIDLTRRHLSQVAPYIHLEVIHTASEVYQCLASDESVAIYDVLLLDYRLPGMNALEVLKELYQIRRVDLPIVLVTGGGSEEVVVQALRLGAADYVVKDADYVYKLPSVLENAFHRVQLARERAALRESEARYRLVSELTSDFAYAFRVEPEGRLVCQWVTDAFQQITGFHHQELSSSVGWVSIIHPDDKTVALHRIQTLMSGKADVGEFRILTKSGEIRWLSDHQRPIWDDQQNRVTGIYGAARDITERKQMEDEHSRLETQFRQAQKMEAIGTLAGGIAHDFNNILTAMVGYTELAKATIHKEDRAVGYLLSVLTAAQRAKDLVKQILSFSRQSDLERKPIQLHSLISETLEFLRASLPSTIEIHRRLSAEAGNILGDPTQVHQILMNLCTNAEHAMRESGGVLEVSLEKVNVTQELVAATPALRLLPYIRLTVRDTGQGIPSVIRERIFDPFFTTKTGSEGTGMGLAVVHGIVRNHEGAITVESTPGVGTTFHVYFPSIGVVTQYPERREVTIPRGNERILFVDDEEILAKLGYEQLTSLGYEVVTHTNSSEALEEVRAATHPFDLVITDQTMPHLTGEGLSYELLRLQPHLPIILCTGFSHIMTPDRVKSLGIRAYHMKPLELRELALTIRRVLDDRQ